MIDTKIVREEMAKLHAEASKFVETYSADVNATPEQQAEQDARFAKLEKLAKSIEDSDKLAKFAFSNDKQATGVKAVLPAKSPDQIKFEAPAPQATREDYAAGLTSFTRGDVPEDYATISVTGNAAIVPQIVVNPITPIKYNCYRAAAVKMGMKPETYGNTAPAVVPVITSASGGLIPEGVQNSSNDANPAVGTMTLTAHGYQSKTYWYSNELINAETFDVTTSTLPALQGAREYGFASAISAAIIADSTITTTVTTPSPTTIALATLDALVTASSLLYDQDKAIFVGMDTYHACEALTDSNGRPIFEMFTVQTENFMAYKGVPVFKHDTFQPLTTAGNVVGCLISFQGFRLRDETEKLVKYVDSPLFVDQTGLNNVRYQGWGYVPAAIIKLIAG